MGNPGKRTGKLGEKREETRKLAGELENLLEGTGFNVLSAHGGVRRPGDICRPTPVLEGYDFPYEDVPLAYLSPVDIAIVDEESRKVKVLCDVEEDGASLKEIMGAELNIMVSTRIMVEGRGCYDYDEQSRWILGVNVPESEGGDRAKKAESLMEIANKASWRIESSIGPYKPPSFPFPPSCEIFCGPGMESVKERIKEVVKRMVEEREEGAELAEWRGEIWETIHQLEVIEESLEETPEDLKALTEKTERLLKVVTKIGEEVRKRHRIMDIIQELGEKHEGGAPIRMVKEEAASEGISRHFVDEMIRREKEKGHLYKPGKDVISLAVRLRPSYRGSRGEERAKNRCA